MRERRLVAIVTACATTVCGKADASGFSIASFGGEHGTPTTTNATALYYNPAGIADSEGGHFYVDSNTAWRYATFNRPAAPSDSPVAADALGANTGHASLLNVIPSPFIGATYRLGRFALGGAFYTPFGGQSVWNKNDHFANSNTYPGAVDGVQRWWAISGVLRSSFYTLGAAYDFGRLSVGVTGNLIQTTVALSEAREPSGENDLRSEGRSVIDVGSWDASFGLGVTYDLIPGKVKLGASYQSRPGVSGGIVTTGTLKTLLVNGALDDNRVAFTTDLPDVFRAGVAYRPRPDVELRFFGDFQTWSVLERQCAYLEGSSCDLNPDGSAKAGSDVIVNQPRRWKDTFGLRGSASFFPARRIELLAGMGYSSNAIPDATYEPGVLDANAATFSLGSIFTVVERLALGLGYMQLLYFPRDTAGKNESATFVSPSRAPDGGGSYRMLAGVANASVDFAF
ncbi:MAG TPA: outer membrane protein transport protein [Polyangiaceae bacterium]|nr:outer membrane protein transport protein [Polyangiaceae bacterium]